MKRFGAVGFIVSVVAGLLTLAPAAQAATFVVTNKSDPAPGACNSNCTLREAIRAANATPAPDRITFATPGTYNLTRNGLDNDATAGDLDITSRIQIVGRPNAGSIVIDGGPSFTDRIFAVIATGRLNISGVTVRDGAVSVGSDGGGFLNEGTLRISNARILSNEAGEGAGVAQDSTVGTLSISNSIVSGNSASDDGSGIYALNGADPVTLSRVRVTGNFAASIGGGLGFEGVVASLSEVTVAGNIASGGGGGIAMQGGASDVTLTRSTITGNSSGGAGGILHASISAELTIIGSLVSDNLSGSTGGGLDSVGTTTILNSTFTDNEAAADGGNIEVSGGVTDVIFSTITGGTADRDNSGAGDGGGIRRVLGTVNVKASIVQGNTDANGAAASTASDCTGTVTSLGSNVLGAGCVLAAGDTFDEAELFGLANNGGPTLTHRFETFSPAKGRVFAADPVCGGVDQRGAPRPGVNADCDSGAYELVLCRNVLVNIVGTNGADNLTGSGGPDGILGLGQNDTIRALGGNDGVCAGGGGADDVDGGAGNDLLDGGPGSNDTCVGGLGTDQFFACENRTQ